MIIPQVSFSKTTTQIISTISECKPCKTVTNFGTYIYSEGTQHRSLHQLPVTMSWVTYFFLQAHTGTGVSSGQHRKNCLSQHRKNSRGLGNNAGEWVREVEVSKEEIPGSKHSMYGYILPYSSL